MSLRNTCSYDKSEWGRALRIRTALRINAVIIKGEGGEKRTCKLWQSTPQGNLEASKVSVFFKEAVFLSSKNSGFGRKVAYCGKTKEIKLLSSY